MTAQQSTARPAPGAVDAALAAVPEALRSGLRLPFTAFVAQLAAQPGSASIDPPWLDELARVFAASEFVATACGRRPELVTQLWASGDLARAYQPGELAARVYAAAADCADEVALNRALRQLRMREAVRIAWRDLAGHAVLAEVMATLSELADACVGAALGRLATWQQAVFGEPRGADGAPVSLVVLALGKLGGGELNFSSDIDLLFAYPAGGETSGPRRVSDHEYFLKLGRRLIDTLSRTTEDGYVFRTDLRLRPNGDSGPLVLSFGAIEHYYQTHGRDWERYALVKARVIAGDAAAGADLVAMLRPFVYRKYLDYGAFESIRAMKALIEREVERKGMGDNIKLGRGGIREIEFMAQSFQLIRGGREPALQTPRLAGALAELAASAVLPPDRVRELDDAYQFLRRVEHRLQMAADRQTHQLPRTSLERERLAFSMGFAGWAAFAAALEAVRDRVHAQFNVIFAERGARPGPAPRSALADVWQATVDDDRALALLATVGYDDPAAALAQLRRLRGGSAYRAFSTNGRDRADRLLPMLAEQAGRAPAPAVTLARFVRVVEAIGRRSAYLALLIENPLALSQFVKLCAASDWIARSLARHPVLLDELIDPIGNFQPLTGPALRAELDGRLARLDGDDLEAQMEVLREFHHAHMLRIAAGDLVEVLRPETISGELCRLAETVLAASLAMARGSLAAKFGVPPVALEAQFAIIGFGKLGSAELGYHSDLDLIFLHNTGPGAACTIGGRQALALEHYFGRLAQRLVHILTIRTPAGVLYEIDTRLRPSGRAGPLLASLSGFADYQRQQAWTWEHQALVRARIVVGRTQFVERFEAVRRAVLAMPREPARLVADIAAMRRKMIAVNSRSTATRFDLKLDRGGIVDIEFIVQYLVLRWAGRYPQLLGPRDNATLLECLGACSLLPAADAGFLAAAYRRYLAMDTRLKLMEQSALIERDVLPDLRHGVSRIWQRLFGDADAAPD